MTGYYKESLLLLTFAQCFRIFTSFRKNNTENCKKYFVNLGNDFKVVIK